MTNRISILGSTGSIGRQTLEVAEQMGLQVVAMTASPKGEITGIRAMTSGLNSQRFPNASRRPNPKDGAMERNISTVSSRSSLRKGRLRSISLAKANNRAAGV